MDTVKECHKCKKSDTELLKCYGCNSIFYCGRDCQKADWKEHKQQCNYKPVSEVKKEEPKKQEEEASKADEYIRIKKAGDGNFSEIWHVEKKDTKKQYALKVISKQKLQQLHKEKDVVMEVHCLNKLDGSDYVIKLFDRFKDDLNLYLVMEYVEGGELWDRLRSFGLISESVIKYFFCHLLKATEFIHSKGIVHRDLKPENIMVDPNNKIKLIDFGTARDLQNPEVKGAGNSARGKRIFEHFVGTPQYMAPECIRNKDSNYKSDVWSLGCILYQFTAGYSPFLGASEYLVFQKSLEKEPIFESFLFSDEKKDLITKMLNRDVNKRISLEEVKQHSYFNSIDFENVISYEEAIKHIQPHEKFLFLVREKLSQVQSEKEEESIRSIIEESKASLKDSMQYDQETKIKLEKWLNLMQRQARAHYHLEDLDWHI